MSANAPQIGLNQNLCNQPGLFIFSPYGLQQFCNYLHQAIGSNFQR